MIHKTPLNSAQLPAQVNDSRSGLTALDYAYQYDGNLNMTRLTDNVNGSYNLTSLTYDGLDRLTNTAGGSGIGSSTIAYDGLGNITSYQSKGHNLTYTYNYTANATTTTGSSNTFLYDGHNRRVKNTSSKGIEYSFYGQDGTLLYRENQANGGGINYIHLGKKLIAKDGFIPENSGKQHYRPYGESIEGAADDVGYTGHKFDKDLGLSYMQARYYDPVIGRFYSNDPVDVMGHMERGNMVQGFGRYTYVNNNPYKYTDPDGEFFNLALGAIGATVGAITGGVSSYMTSGGDLGATLKGAGIGAGIGALAGVTGGTSIVGFGKAADLSLKASTASTSLSAVGTSSLKMAATSGASNAAGQIAGGADEINMTQVATSAAGGLVPGAGAGAILASTGTKTVNSVAGTAVATVVADTMNVGTQVIANGVAEDLNREKD